MSLKDINRRHLYLVSLYWNRYAVRSGSGLMFLMIALVFGLTVAHVVLTPVEMIQRQQKREGLPADPEKIVETISNLAEPVLRWALNIESGENETISPITPPSQPFSQPQPDQPLPGMELQSDERPGPAARAGGLAGQPDRSSTDEWTTFLLYDRPALLSAIFLILLFGMPFLIPFLAFNQVSGDVQSRGLRYVLLRTERSNIVLGRFIGTAVFSAAVTVVIIATITFYIGVKIRIYPAGELTMWALHAFCALAFLMLPYIAVCSMISATVDSPFLSLVLTQLVIGGMPLLVLIGSLAWKPAVYLKYSLPWGVQNYLLHPNPLYCVGAVLALLGYTALFLGVGYWRFETRDL